MTDRKWQELKDIFQLLHTYDVKKEQIWNDLKAKRINVHQFEILVTPISYECNNLVMRLQELDEQGYHFQPWCVRLLDGSLKRIGERLYGDSYEEFVHTKEHA